MKVPLTFMLGSRVDHRVTGARNTTNPHRVTVVGVLDADGATRRVIVVPPTSGISHIERGIARGGYARG